MYELPSESLDQCTAAEGGFPQDSAASAFERNNPPLEGLGGVSLESAAVQTVILCHRLRPPCFALPVSRIETVFLLSRQDGFTRMRAYYAYQLSLNTDIPSPPSG